MKAQTVAYEQGKPSCFLFNRVSTSTAEQETSLEQQEHDSYRYAERKGLHVVYNFRVQETGSKEEERHVFNQMITLLKSDLIDVEHVIFKSADRSSRNRHDKDQLDKLRKSHGITIHYYGSGKILTGESHYTDELQDDIENLFATHFARELSHKIKSAYRHKAFEKKQAPGSRAPLGYLWDKNRREFVRDPQTKSLVKKIFHKFDTGRYSLSQFADYCNENNLLPASGKPWEKGRMEKFLKNPFYCGWFRFNGEICEGSHPAFFSKEVYDNRLARMSANRNGIMSGRTAHLLSRFVRCPNCGRAFVAELQHGENRSGNYTYYKHQCKNSNREIRIKEEELFQQIDRAIESYRFSDSFREKLKAIFFPPLKKQKEKHRKEIQYLSNRIAEINSRKMKLYDLFLDEEINKMDLLEKRRQYDEQIKLLQRQRNSLEIDSKKVFHTIIESIELIKKTCDDYLSVKNRVEKVKILKKMISGLEAAGSENFRLVWEKPYSFLMRGEMEKAISKDDVEVLRTASHHTDEKQFNSVNFCAQKRT